MKKHTKGFTLIELLVVVAIIGILATVVLASLGQARDRAQDAAARSSLSQLRSEMALHALENNADFRQNGSGNTCIQDGLDYVEEAAKIVGGTLGSEADCYATETEFSAEVLLNNGNHFCVDSTGFSGEGTTSPTAALNTSPDALC